VLPDDFRHAALALRRSRRSRRLGIPPSTAAAPFIEGVNVATDSPAPTLRAIADPAPLGLAGFALTTFVLSVFNANILDKGVTVVLGLTLAYGGIAQLLAGMWEFHNGNTFGALAFTSYGSFWISAWYLLTFNASSTTAKAIGTYFLAWAIFTLYMTIAAAKTNAVLLAVFVGLLLALLCLAFGNMSLKTGAATDGLIKLGGWLGIITALLAWYVSAAGVINTTWRRQVLPTYPLP
jgi:uncharacterized protein